jgi:hypothetical protein
VLATLVRRSPMLRRARDRVIVPALMVGFGAAIAYWNDWMFFKGRQTESIGCPRVAAARRGRSGFDGVPHGVEVAICRTGLKSPSDRRKDSRQDLAWARDCDDLEGERPVRRA